MGQRITDLIQLARHFLMFHFEVRDCSHASRTPVHHVLAAIDQPFFIKPYKNFDHGTREALVHGEVLAVPIHGRAQPLHLRLNRAAVLPLPLPHPFDERFPAHVLPLLALTCKLALHHHLRSNAGVVGPRKPQRGKTAHAPPADDDVHLRLIEHVAHVQASGDVGRR